MIFVHRFDDGWRVCRYENSYIFSCAFSIKCLIRLTCMRGAVPFQLRLREQENYRGHSSAARLIEAVQVPQY